MGANLVKYSGLIEGANRRESTREGRAQLDTGRHGKKELKPSCGKKARHESWRGGVRKAYGARRQIRVMTEEGERKGRTINGVLKME